MTARERPVLGSDVACEWVMGAVGPDAQAVALAELRHHEGPRRLVSPGDWSRAASLAADVLHDHLGHDAVPVWLDSADPVSAMDAVAASAAVVDEDFVLACHSPFDAVRAAMLAIVIVGCALDGLRFTGA